MIIVWGVYIKLVISCAILYQLVENNDEISELLDSNSKAASLKLIQTQSQVSVLKEESTFWTNWKIVKSESLQIILAYFLQYLVFPGIFYSLEVSYRPIRMYFLTFVQPIEKFEGRLWSIMINLASGLADVLGRVIGDKLFKNYYVATYSVLLVIIFDFFCLNMYLGSFVVFRVVAYFIIFIAFFNYLRTSSTLLFYILRGNKKSTKTNQKDIGSILSNSIAVGIAAGNMCSNCLPFIQEAIKHSSTF